MLQAGLKVAIKPFPSYFSPYVILIVSSRSSSADVRPRMRCFLFLGPKVYLLRGGRHRFRGFRLVHNAVNSVVAKLKLQ